MGKIYENWGFRGRVQPPVEWETDTLPSNIVFFREMLSSLLQHFTVHHAGITHAHRRTQMKLLLGVDTNAHIWENSASKSILLCFEHLWFHRELGTWMRDQQHNPMPVCAEVSSAAFSGADFQENGFF